MRLYVGLRVPTPLGWGRIVAIHNAEDTVAGHGKPIRGLAGVAVELDRGGRRLYKAPEILQAIREEGEQ
jgi:hypothetical protein